MSDVDSMLSTDERDMSIMQRLKRPLFTKERKLQGVSPSDVIAIEGHNSVPQMYAITVNIQPTKKMNSKQWQKYTFAEQKAILTRVELSIRKKNPSINLKQLVFEECPKLHQIHFHALYEHTSEWNDTLLANLNRICGSTGRQTNPWRTVDSQLVYNIQGWIEYINKTAKIT